jgi:hypothetical protein
MSTSSFWNASTSALKLLSSPEMNGKLSNDLASKSALDTMSLGNNLTT